MISSDFDYELRTTKARNLMQKHEVDCLYLTGDRNKKYFSGVGKNSSWPTFLAPYILPLEGEPARVVTPMFETYVTTDPCKKMDSKFYIFTDGDDAMARKQVNQALSDLEVEKGTIGVEQKIGLADFELLKAAAPQATIKQVSNTILDPLRMIKDDLEITNIRKAAEINDRFFETAVRVIKEGVTYFEIRLELLKTMIKEGADTARTRGFGFNRKAKKGDIINYEPIPRVNGYGIELARCLWVGEPTSKERKMWDVCVDTYHKVEDAVRPGVTMHELDLLYRKIMSEGLKNIVPDWIQPWKIGHGMGLGPGHEHPMVQEGNMTKVAKNMVFVIDPGIGHIKKPSRETGIGVPINLISTVLVTEKGCERLDQFPFDLFVL